MAIIILFDVPQILTCYLYQFVKFMNKNHKIDQRALKKDQPKSYLTRYRQSNQIQRSSKISLRQQNDSIWNKGQIQQRRQKIITTLMKQSEITRIRIQQQSMQSQFLQDDYLDLEIMWLKKTEQIKEETHKLHMINSKQSKIIESLRQELELKREKLKQLEGRIQDINKTSQDTAVGDEEEQNDFISKEHFKMIQEYQKELGRLQKDREVILKQNQNLERNIQQVRTKITEMQPKIADFKSRQNEIRAKKQSLLIELRQIKSENRELQKTIERQSQIQAEVEINIVEYIQLAESVFIIRELQKLEQLMIDKEAEQERKEIYIQNTQFLKQKGKELQNINTRVRQKQSVIEKLTFDIKQKSIEQLNLYSY